MIINFSYNINGINIILKDNQISFYQIHPTYTEISLFEILKALSVGVFLCYLIGVFNSSNKFIGNKI